MFTIFLWFGTACLAAALVFLIVRDIRFRTSGRLIDAVARVTGYKEDNDDDGYRIYYHRLTYTDHRQVSHEISGGVATRTPKPIGTEVRVRYPEDRPHMARERDGGCRNIFAYFVITTMLLAFGTAAMLGFGADR